MECNELKLYVVAVIATWVTFLMTAPHLLEKDFA